MLSRQSRVDELKKSLDLLVQDILQNLRKGDSMNAEVMVQHMNQMLLELRTYHAHEPLKVEEYLKRFQQYEQEIRVELITLRQQVASALANTKRMEENIG